MSTQVRRLMAANRELRDANSDLTATNIEMHQANEEYLVNTEEIQAAAEEVETLNEELQATNEELETLNEELQATVEELNATNEDLEARSSELQGLVREREEQRRASESTRGELEAVVLGMADGVLVVNDSGQALLTNRAYHDMFGEGTASLPCSDERGMPIPPEELARSRAARGESFSTIFTVATEPSSSEDDRRWYEASGNPILINGHAQGGVIVIRDITDRSLRRLQSEFLAMASHELRTPLSSVQAALQLAQRQLDEQVGARRAASAKKGTVVSTKAEKSVKDPAEEDAFAELQPVLEIALRQIRRLNTLVNDLVDIGRLQSHRLHLQFQPVDLAEIAKHAVESVQIIAPEHQIELTAPHRPQLIQGDAVRVEQIVFNLLTNAVIYAPDSPRIDVRIRQDKDSAELQVQDYGPGIQPEKLAYLFTAFYQIDPQHLRRSGLGLGLFIAHELVRAHGGTISVSSQLEVGTTFTVTFPRLRSE